MTTHRMACKLAEAPGRLLLLCSLQLNSVNFDDFLQVGYVCLREVDSVILLREDNFEFIADEFDKHVQHVF